MSTEDLVSDETLSGLQRERVGRTSKLHATDVVALTRLMAKAQQQMGFVVGAWCAGCGLARRHDGDGRADQVAGGHRAFEGEAVMAKYGGDGVILDSGREIYANCGIVGIDERGFVSEGYDGEVYTKKFTDAERRIYAGLPSQADNTSMYDERDFSVAQQIADSDALASQPHGVKRWDARVELDKSEANKAAGYERMEIERLKTRVAMVERDNLQLERERDEVARELGGVDRARAALKEEIGRLLFEAARRTDELRELQAEIAALRAKHLIPAPDPKPLPAVKAISRAWGLR